MSDIPVFFVCSAVIFQQRLRLQQFKIAVVYRDFELPQPYLPNMAFLEHLFVSFLERKTKMCPVGRKMQMLKHTALQHCTKRQNGPSALTVLDPHKLLLIYDLHRPLPIQRPKPKLTPPQSVSPPSVHRVHQHPTPQLPVHRAHGSTRPAHRLTIAHPAHDTSINTPLPPFPFRNRIL